MSAREHSAKDSGEPQRRSGASRPPVRLLVAAGHAGFRQVLAALLSRNGDVSVVGEAGDVLDAVSQARELTPDVVLMDASLPEANGLRASLRIREELPGTYVILMTGEDDQDYLAAARATGVDGCVPKVRVDTDLIPMVEALRGDREAKE